MARNWTFPAWLGFATVIALAPAGGCSNRQTALDAEWKQLQANAAAEGVPLDAKGAVAAPPPESENAAEAIKLVYASILNPPRPGQAAAFQQGLKSELNEASKVVTEAMAGSPTGPQTLDWDEFAQNMRVLDPHVKDLEAALALPKWDFKRPYEQGDAMLLPDLARAKSCAKWLAASALNAEHQGRRKDALHALRSCFRFGGHLRSEPNLIGVLVGISCEKIGESAAINLAQMRPNDRAFHRELQSIVMAPRKPVDMEALTKLQFSSMTLMATHMTDPQDWERLGMKYEEKYKVDKIKMLELRNSGARNAMECWRLWRDERDAKAQYTKLVNIEQSFKEDMCEASPLFRETWGEGEDAPSQTQLAATVQTTSLASQRLTAIAIQMIGEGKQGGIWLLPKAVHEPRYKSPTGAKYSLAAIPGGFELTFNLDADPINPDFELKGASNGEVRIRVPRGIRF